MYLNGKVPVSLSRTTVEMAIYVLLHLLVSMAASQRQSPIQHPAHLRCSHKKQNESSTKLNKRQINGMACSKNQSKQAPARVQLQHKAKIITAALKQQQRRKKNKW